MHFILGDVRIATLFFLSKKRDARQLNRAASQVSSPESDLSNILSRRN